MFLKDWGNMTDGDQVSYLSRLMHVVISNMEKGIGARDAQEVFGATASIIYDMPNPTIRSFYFNRQSLLQDQMKKALDCLKSYGQVAQFRGRESKKESTTDREFMSIYPNLPEIENFVEDMFNSYSKWLKSVDRNRSLFTPIKLESSYLQIESDFPTKADPFGH